MDVTKSATNIFRLFCVVFGLFIIFTGAVSAQSGSSCATPTRVDTPTAWPTVTPISPAMMTVTPFPTPTPYTITVEMPFFYTNVLTYTTQLSETNQDVYDLAVSSTLAVSTTAVIMPIKMLKAVMDLSTFAATIIVAIIAAFNYRLIMRLLLTLVSASEIVAEKIRQFMAMLMPSWKEIAVVTIVFGSMYACNRIF